MGIRTLHRRQTPTATPANADRTPSPAEPPAAADASTARIPADRMAPLRHTTAATRRHLARALIAALALTEPPTGSTPSRHPHRPPYCQDPHPEQDATP